MEASAKADDPYGLGTLEDEEAKGPLESRLKAAILCHGKEVEAGLDGSDEARKRRQLAIANLFRLAKEAFGRKELDLGWKCLHAARRMELLDLPAEHLEARIASLRSEVGHKLHSWRKEAAETLLREPAAGGAEAATGGKDLLSRRAAAWQAALLLEEQFNNQYHKVRLTQRFLVWLIAILGAALGLVAIFAVAGGFPDDPAFPAPGGGVLPALLTGLLGGSFSGVLSTVERDGKTRIPEQLSSLMVAATRSLVGATAGVAAYLLVRAGIVPLSGASTWAVLAVAFAAGFSERLVVRHLKTG